MVNELRHSAILDRTSAALVVIDMQEAFRAAIPDFAQVAARVAKLVQGCKILGVPIIATEQYPKGLGRTAPEIAQHLAEPPIEKVAFSACGAAGFADRLLGKQVLLCGIEAHVCVSQTAHDLLNQGAQVHLITDAVSSRVASNREIGIAKMLRSGAVGSSFEMALFELMRTADAPEFKAIQRLVKS